MVEQNKNNVMGEWRDIIHYKNGSIIETEWNHNIIVSGINILIAALFSNAPTLKGICHWAVGSGASSWDSLYPNIPLDSSRTLLFNEIGRKAVSELVFLNTNNEPVGTRTNRIRATAIFETADCIGDWREFGLFGGDSTNTVNSGIMIDHKVHQKYIKTSDVIVERQIRFIFN
jgi:hypothetical protein